MARLIFISPYLKGREDRARLTHRTNYIATREGVELLKSEHGNEPATKKQREYISRLIKSFPQSKELAEYGETRLHRRRQLARTGEFLRRRYSKWKCFPPTRRRGGDFIEHPQR